MTWGKMDDKFHRNRKVRELRRIKGGREALGVWVFWWSWCLDDPGLTGLVPSYELDAAERKSAKLLVEAGLWDEAEDGYRFHDFHDYNPTKEQVESKRESDRTRIANKRDASRVDVASDSDATNPRVASTRVPGPAYAQPRESASALSARDPAERVSHSDAQDAFSRLRKAHNGAPFRAKHTEYQKVSDLADFATSQAETKEERLIVLETTIRGYLASTDPWCLERKHPISGMHDFGVLYARGLALSAPSEPAKPRTRRDELLEEREAIRPYREGRKSRTVAEAEAQDRRWAEIQSELTALRGAAS